MLDILMQKYNNTQPGSSAWLRSDAAELHNFESVVDAAKLLAQRGLIHIIQIHKESHTGNGYADSIHFTRLK